MNNSQCESSSGDREGVIKYQLEHQFGALAADLDVREINAWRSVLYRLQLIGQSEDQYHGLGYGNLSQRLVPEQAAFLITGTQTGHLPRLDTGDFAIVEFASPRENLLRSCGPSQPSSEALTHASVYQHQPQAGAVIHVHCPELWRNTTRLRLPHTGAEIDYGSVAMSDAVAELFRSGQLQRLSLFSMLGHEDGIVAFGNNLASAAITLLTQLVEAIRVE